ncbi:MAG: isoprenoid biosynthesis protein ElbB [Rickettsiales bacterium]|mgnify:CR=1 FL=1|nr:isoprenoid biosynthesis protein ElbB [Rickettsiales bacterium]|tara:strand:- start:604 stop:1260 length:657 start_codon:yes stop_codon:yes gene_type:complete
MSESKVLVLLSGCGVFDGAEIHESVLTLLSLSRCGASWTIAAPDKDQAHVIDHHLGQPTEEKRNVRSEAARIARGPVLDLNEVDCNEFDAIFLPGGFGAAKNLNTFAFDGAKCSIDEQVERVLKDFHSAHKPIGAVCIAPTVVARALGLGTMTIGSNAETAAALEAMGATHQECSADEIVVDEANRLVTAPAYMCEAPLHEIATGIDKAVRKLVELAN